VNNALLSAGASAVIYGGVDEKGIVYADVDHALRVPQSDIRLFGKPESFLRRRMGVALAYGDDVNECRQRARESASRVRPMIG
jgi:phosphoribosylglycinamide formyltransferase 2